MDRGSRALGLILLLGLLIRLGYAFSVPEPTLLVFDGLDYRDIAANIAAGRGFSISTYRWFEPVPPDAPAHHPDFYRPPLLPLIGAGYFFLPGPWLFYARLSTAVLGTLAILLVYGVGRRLFGSRSALAAAACMAIYPYAIVYSGRWSTENLALVTLWGALFLWFRGSAETRWHYVLSGVLLGAASLTRPNLFPLALAGVVVSWWRLGVRSAVWVAVGLILVSSPWMVRNASHTQIPNPVTFFGPYNMWLGMNDGIYEMYRHPASPEFRAQRGRLYEELTKERVRQLEEQGTFDVREVNRCWLREYLGYVRAEPARAAYILGSRCLHSFRPWTTPAMVSRKVFLLSISSLVPLLLLGIYALATDPRSRDPLLLSMLLTSFATSLLFTFQLRLRFPVFDPMVVLFGAHGLVLCMSRYRRSRFGHR